MDIRYRWRAHRCRTKRDPTEISWIMRNVKAGDVCFDVGAHKGSWTYWLRKAVGRSGAVYAFEPQPTLYEYLRSQYRSSYWSNVTVEDSAFSNSEGTVDLYVPGQPGSISPCASLKQSVLDQEGEARTVQVSTKTIDDYVVGAGVDSIAFIKVDVEGAELDVIQGASSTLSNHRPSWIIESESRHIGEQGVTDLFAKMEEAGYQGSFFSPEGLRPLSEFVFNLHQRQEGECYWDGADYCNNFLFIPKG